MSTFHPSNLQNSSSSFQDESNRDQNEESHFQNESNIRENDSKSMEVDALKKEEVSSSNNGDQEFNTMMLRQCMENLRTQLEAHCMKGEEMLIIIEKEMQTIVASLVEKMKEKQTKQLVDIKQGFEQLEMEVEQVQGLEGELENFQIMAQKIMLASSFTLTGKK